MKQPPESLEAKVLKWIEQRGYVLELQTERAFAGDGWRTRVGAFYQDPENGGPREIDLYAYLEHRDVLVGRDPNGNPLRSCARVVCAIECKKSSRPWVVFTTLQAPDTPRFLFLGHFANGPGRSALRKAIEPDESFQQLGLSSRLFVGHRLVRVNFGKSGDGDESDVVHDALYSAVKAAVARSIESANQMLEFGVMGPLELVWPIVVLDGDLFEFHVTAGSQPRLKQVEVAKVLWSIPVQNTRWVVVTIVTKKALTHSWADAEAKLAHRLLASVTGHVAWVHENRNTWYV